MEKFALSLSNQERHLNSNQNNLSFFQSVIPSQQRWCMIRPLMKQLILWSLILGTLPVHARPQHFPPRYLDLLSYVQAAPDQGETNTCWFVASTGAMELLLNQRDRIKNPKPNGKNDLAESFLIWQRNWWSKENPPRHFIEEVVQRFNHGEAVEHKHWPFIAYHTDGSDNMQVWHRHIDFLALPRIQVPLVETELLFARGKKYATYVLNPEDIQTIKSALVTNAAPVIVNYNDDGYWHVVLIVGYDDEKAGSCYELEADECNPKGAFFVRDSNGQRFEARAYNWFLYRGNAAAVVRLKPSASR
jgi:C1A family cysteine protease